MGRMLKIMTEMSQVMVRHFESRLLRNINEVND